MTEEVSPGDLIYFAPNNATGVILRHSATDPESWVYSLRSPTVANRGVLMVSVYQEKKAKFVNLIKDGKVIHCIGSGV